jgi:hypothetical protein
MMTFVIEPAFVAEGLLPKKYALRFQSELSKSRQQLKSTFNRYHSAAQNFFGFQDDKKRKIAKANLTYFRE